MDWSIEDNFFHMVARHKILSPGMGGTSPVPLWHFLDMHLQGKNSILHDLRAAAGWQSQPVPVRVSIAPAFVGVQ